MIIHNGVVQSQKTMRTQGRDRLVDKTMFAFYLDDNAMMSCTQKRLLLTFYGKQQPWKMFPCGGKR